ncbi:MAG: tRNA pseudouridine(38-40) synthase TruA [Flavisolibacter sp.]
MSRYFIDLSYKGSRYSGFQVQENANTIQSEVEKAFTVLQRAPVSMTGSSRTDTGVHALQNYFHFDYEEEVHPQFIYKMNALLPQDIVIRNVYLMPSDAHCRFDAVARAYEYRVHRIKNPFDREVSLFFPYRLDGDKMQEGAALIKSQTNFFAFSKTNTQVKNFECKVNESHWEIEGEQLIYHIEANRFLRGMVRLLTASLLRLGRHRTNLEEFSSLFEGRVRCGHSVPPQGLFLTRVRYAENYFPAPLQSLGSFH